MNSNPTFFSSEPPQQQQQQQQAGTNASIDFQPIINHRILISLQQASKIIGIKGTTISTIRSTNNVKIGISNKVAGCSDRILSCSGNVINVANALGDIVDLLNRDKTNEPMKYHFHFLNNILPPPSLDEIKDLDQLNKIGNLKLIILNSQLSSIIGKGGSKIKSLILKHGVKIVASKDFLPDSNERILELQGFPGAITNTIIDINEILINDVDINFINEKRYFPHLKTSQDDNEVKTTVLIPENYVGAIIGKENNRIINLKKYTKTRIIITNNDSSPSSSTATTGNDDEYDQPSENYRSFTIIGSNDKNVKLAESMLLKNLETEIQRRQLRLTEQEHQNNEEPSDFDAEENE